MRLLLAFLALAAGLTAAPATRAQEPDLAPSRLTAQERSSPLHHILVDALFVRPVGLPTTALLGGGFWLLGAPIFAVTGDMDWWTDVCLEEPLRQQIRRPLGQF